MKFGARLTGQSVHEWRAHNILYNELKHEIRNVTTGRPPSQKQLNKLAEFFNEEFDNFTLVIKSKVGEIDYRIVKCEDLVAALTSHHDPQTKSQFTREISRLTRDLQQLSRFSRAQYIGFRKLIKKYRKWSEGGTALDAFNERLEADDSAALIDLTPRFLELSMLWDMAREGRFEALNSIRGEHYVSSAPSAAHDAQFAAQTQSVRVWIPSDSVMEVLLTLLPHMHLDGTDEATGTYLDNDSFDYVRNSRRPGEIRQCQDSQDSWLCAPTGGLRRFTISRLNQHQTQQLMEGTIPHPENDDVAKRLALGWIEATRAKIYAKVTSLRTRYSQERPADSDLLDASKVWAVIDERIVVSTQDGSRSFKFPHAVLEICWTGDTPAFVEEVQNSHLVCAISRSFSLFTLAALTLYPDTFVGRPSWLRLLEEGADIRRAAQAPVSARDRTQNPPRKLSAKPSTSILLNSQAPDLEEDDDADAEASSPSTLRYWNEFDYPDEEGDYAIFVDAESAEEARTGVAEQLSLPIIQFSQKVRRSVKHVRSLITGVSNQTSPEPEERETDPLLPYSPRLGPHDVAHYESFPHADARVAMRDMIMAMISCVCYLLAGIVTFLAYSIIIGDDGASGLLSSVRSIIIIGLLFGVAFSGLGAAIFNLQTNPSWLGQVTAQSAFFGLVCTGAGGIAWVATA